MKPFACFLLAICYNISPVRPTVSGQSRTLTDFEADEDDDGAEMNVLIGYKPGQHNSHIGKFALKLSERRHKKKRKNEGLGLARVNAVRASLNRTMIRELQQHGDIMYVEEDHKVQLLREIRTDALRQVQGLTKAIPKPSSSMTGACNDPDSFKIGIIDSGLDDSHPDLPCFNMGTSEATCIGDEFGIPEGQLWNKPTLSHGTMTGGIIAAIRGNNQGISGMLDNSKVCLIVARVFADDSDGSTDLSSILDGIYWVYEQGAKVINLSLGGPSTAFTAQHLYRSIRDSGVLLVAAAGNDGSSTKSYPASYDSCISVAAVDADLSHAAFSQHNEEVDITAPGVHVLSTAPLGLGALAGLSLPNSLVLGAFLQNSPLPTSNLTGPLIECPNLGKDTCPGDTGQICLIERGDIYFEEKALNCEAGGGIAAVIYNNIDYDLEGAALATPTSVTIPVISLSKQIGQRLLNRNTGQTVTLTAQDGYEYADGTSFSAPFVAGGAAAIWQACPSCSADDVEGCLLESARDLGASGVDEYFGHGLLQVEDAYSCLVNSAQCCNSSPSSAQATSPATPSSPTPAPSALIDTGPTSTQDCSSEEEAYASCFDNQLTVWEEEICRYCINAAIPFDLQTPSCSEIETMLCPAITNTCSVYCGSCVEAIDVYMSCAVNTVRSDCLLDCSFGASSETGGFGEDNGVDDSPTSSAPTSPSGPDENAVVGIIEDDESSPTSSPAQSAAPTRVVSAAAFWVAGVFATLLL